MPGFDYPAGMILNDRTTRAPDGTSIAFAVAGRGPAVMLTNGLTTSSFFWKYLQPRWSQHYTVITWDLPGHGRSAPARSDGSATIAGQPAIMARVMEAAKVERATHIGWSVGCQVVLELARQMPERCSALVTLFGSFRQALSSTRLPVPSYLLRRSLAEPHGALVARLVQHFAQLARFPAGMKLLRRANIIGAQTSDADVRGLIAELRRLDPSTNARLARSAEQHSAEDMLPGLRLPLLIMAGERDPFAPPHIVGEPLHRAVPHSTFVRLPEATHTALLDHHDAIAHAFAAFAGAARA